MDEQLLSQYITTVQELMIQGSQDKYALKDLAQCVSQYLNDTKQDHTSNQFFLGEMAFFTGKYELASKKYAHLSDLPYSDFFLYRSNAFLYKKEGKIDVAIESAQKALAIFPEDYVTLQLLKSLWKAKKVTEEWQRVSNVITDVVKKHQRDAAKKKQEPSIPSLPQSSVSLSEEEFSQLETLFFQQEEDAPSYDTPSLEEEPPASIPSSFSSSTDGDSFLPDSPSFSREPLEDYSSDSSSTDPASLFSSDDSISYWNEEPLSLSSFPSIDLEYTLEEKLSHFRDEKVALFSQQAISLQNPLLKENLFLGLHGWEQAAMQKENPTQHSSISPFLPGYFKKMSGGFYLRWRNKGIVINPGMSFLHALYQRHFSISDIDAVIITRDALEACSDVKGIFDLNEQQNALKEADSPPHVIQYYLNRQVYRNFTGVLNPHFKEERDMLHCLDFYLDSQAEEESTDITDGVRLVYLNPLQSNHLVIKLQLQDDDIRREVGFISEVGWSSTFASFFRQCDVIVAGFGLTDETDYNKLHYSKNYLGYFGCYSLLTSTQPSLFVLTEFNGAQGDIRVEIAKKMRQEYIIDNPNNETTIVVNDFDFQYNLTKMKAYCSLCKTLSSPNRMRTVKSSEAFGSFQYLCVNCYL